MPQIQVNRLYKADCRTLLKFMIKQGLKADMWITSPPYWSLRDYGIKPTIWGGDPDCEHEWGSKQLVEYENEKIRWQHTGSGSTTPKGESSQGQFCKKCNAWLGCLGLEPNFELWVKHLCDIYDLVWRALNRDFIGAEISKEYYDIFQKWNKTRSARLQDFL